jgi:hypothetical protein
MKRDGWSVANYVSLGTETPGAFCAAEQIHVLHCAVCGVIDVIEIRGLLIP